MKSTEIANRNRLLFGLRCSLALALGAVLCVYLGACRSTKEGLYPSNLAPDFSLMDLSGRQVRLSDFRGRLVLLNFWATWCASCVVEMPALVRLRRAMDRSKFTIVSVALRDAKKNLLEFKEEKGLDFPILLDVDGTVARRYELKGVPESFLVDAEGRLVLFDDPETGRSSVRIIGERNWDGPEMIRRIKGLLNPR